jgi:hypothetical protein
LLGRTGTAARLLRPPPVAGFCDHLFAAFGGEHAQCQWMHGVLMGLLGGRPRGFFRAVIVPWVEISPPQIP